MIENAMPASFLRLLGLRATIEVLKQLPVIAKRNELAKATEHFIPRTRMFAEPPPSPPLRFCSRSEAREY